MNPFILFRACAPLLTSLGIAIACGSTETDDPKAYLLDETWDCSGPGSDYECLCRTSASAEGDCRELGATQCCRIFETGDGAVCRCDSLSQSRCPPHVGGLWVDGCPPTRFVEPSFFWTCYDDGEGCQCRASNVPQTEGACSQAGCCALLPIEASVGLLPGHRCVCTEDPANACRLHSEYFATPVPACPPPEPPREPLELAEGWSCSGIGQDCRCISARGALTAPCPDKPACCTLSNDGQTCSCTKGKTCPDTGITRCPPP